ncbi:hypothetical protein Tco_1171112 [Tanacetum coccineum]
MLQDAIAMSPISLAQSSSSHQSAIQAAKSLSELKRDRGDDDKETKKRRTGKDTESLKKSSNPKESSRGKPPSKTSKSRKSRSVNDVVKETVFEMGSDDDDQTFDKKADDSEQPSPDANTEQPYPTVAANLTRQKNDWYKKSPSLEPQDPD